MGLSTRTLIAVYCIAVTLILGFLAYITIKEFQKPLPSELYQSTPKNKITFNGSELLKIRQPSEITFILGESRNVSHKEMLCLAKNIYHEARGEGFAGMIGVAQITVNRADTQYRNKKTLCDVVNDPNQFSWTSNKKNKKLDKLSWQQSIHIAQLVILGIRIKEVNDSIYFHSNKIKSPKWIKDFPLNGQIGNHIYRGIIS